MARSLYTRSFIAVAGLSPSSGGVTYVVPAGFIIVVRDIRYYTNPTLSTAQLFVTDDTTGATIYYHEVSASSRGEFGREQRTVLEEHHVLKARTGGHDGDVTISGYLLSKS